MFITNCFKNSELYIIKCGCGEIGRHARFRFWCRKVCGFESLHPHNSKQRADSITERHEYYPGTN